MSERVTAERVKAFAAAARVPIQDDAAARAARAVDPTAAQADAGGLVLGFEMYIPKLGLVDVNKGKGHGLVLFVVVMPVSTPLPSTIS